MVILNICPFLFAFIIRKNRSKLDNIVIKDKFGTLYLGLKPKKTGVVNYSFVFLLRRSLFVAITFALFGHAGLQIQLMIYMTVLYIIYLGYADFFETFGAKALEIVNESVFILIQYQFVLLHNLVWEDEKRKSIGTIIIALTCFLLALNFIIIIYMSLRNNCRKQYWKYLKC